MTVGVPHGVAAAALAAFSARDREATLAELVSDSADEDGRHAEVADVRTVVFAGGGFDVTVSLRENADGHVLAVELLVDPAPDKDPQVDVRDREAPQVEQTAPGRWALARVTPGPLRLVLTSQDRRVQTEWMLC